MDNLYFTIVTTVLAIVKYKLSNILPNMSDEEISNISIEKIITINALDNAIPWVMIPFTFFSVHFFGNLMPTLIAIRKIKNMVWPLDWCYDVTICTRSLYDIYLKNNAENVCIRYVNNKDHNNAIQYSYVLAGREYSDYVTIDFAKELFDCDLLQYL